MHNYSLQLKNMFFQTNWMNEGQTKAVSRIVRYGNGLYYDRKQRKHTKKQHGSQGESIQPLITLQLLLEQIGIPYYP